MRTKTFTGIQRGKWSDVSFGVVLEKRNQKMDEKKQANLTLPTPFSSWRWKLKVRIITKTKEGVLFVSRGKRKEVYAFWDGEKEKSTWKEVLAENYYRERINIYQGEVDECRSVEAARSLTWEQRKEWKILLGKKNAVYNLTKENRGMIDVYSCCKDEVNERESIEVVRSSIWRQKYGKGKKYNCEMERERKKR